MLLGPKRAGAWVRLAAARGPGYTVIMMPSLAAPLHGDPL
jgi:hypothetical protein